MNALKLWIISYHQYRHLGQCSKESQFPKIRYLCAECTISIGVTRITRRENRPMVFDIVRNLVHGGIGWLIPFICEYLAISMTRSKNSVCNSQRCRGSFASSPWRSSNGIKKHTNGEQTWVPNFQPNLSIRVFRVDLGKKSVNIWHIGWHSKLLRAPLTNALGPRFKIIRRNLNILSVLCHCRTQEAPHIYFTASRKHQGWWCSIDCTARRPTNSPISISEWTKFNMVLNKALHSFGNNHQSPMNVLSPWLNELDDGTQLCHKCMGRPVTHNV